MPATKTKCPVTRAEFNEHAKPMKFTVGETTIELDPRQFEKSGSMGWNANMKITVLINGKRCQCQVGCNITLVGSKELPK